MNLTSSLTARPMIPHSRPLLGDDLIRAAQTVTASGYLAQGPHVDRFERAVAAFLEEGAPASRGAWGGVAVNSGTTALFVALAGLGIGAGDEVIVPSYVCAAVTNAVRQAGATPVVADVERGGFNLCAGAAARRRTRRTRAVIVPHMFGCPASLEALLGLGLPLVEDCAQAIGARYRGRPLGSFGAAAAISFYATKVLTTGEGGMALCPDPAAVARMRDLRDYDNKEDDRPRLSCKMTDLQGAVGLSQWARLPGIIERRRQLARRFDAGLAGLGVTLPEPCEGAIYYRYVLRLNDTLHVERERQEILAALRRAGVDAKRPVHAPLHRFSGDDCPHAEAAYRTAISLPLYPALTDDEAESVVRITRRVLETRRPAGYRGRVTRDAGRATPVPASM